MLTMRQLAAITALSLFLLLSIASTGYGQCEQAKVDPSDGLEIDRFGQAVAVSDGLMLVGSHFNDEFGANAGAAYVYKL
jgi:hypothetical protein